MKEDTVISYLNAHPGKDITARAQEMQPERFAEGLGEMRDILAERGEIIHTGRGGRGR